MGYSIVNQELEVGVWAVAVPIYDPSGKVVAGLGIARLSEGESCETMLMKFLPRLQHGARELAMFFKMICIRPRQSDSKAVDWFG